MEIFRCSRSNYLISNTIFPAIMGLFLLAGLAETVVMIVRYIRNNNLEKGQRGALLVRTAISVVVFVVLLSISAGRLRRGLPLLFETDGMAWTVSGVVEQIQSVPATRYYLDDHEGALHASLVCVNGASYYFITADGIRVGDEVTVSYLPHSGMVLGCSKGGNDP